MSRSAAMLSRRSSSTRLHDLGDRRADLVGEEASAPPSRTSASADVGVVEPGVDEVRDVHGDYANDPGSSIGVTVASRGSHREQRRGRLGEQRLADAAPSPLRIERRRAQLDTGRRVPQQRRPRAVPAHRERQRPDAQREVVHRDVLTQPLGPETREQVDVAVGARARAPAAPRAANVVRCRSAVERAAPADQRLAGRSDVDGRRASAQPEPPPSRRRLRRRSPSPRARRTTVARRVPRASRSARRRIDLVLPRLRAARPAAPRSSWRSQPRSTALGSASASSVERLRRSERRAQHRRGAAPATSSATSTGAPQSGGLGRAGARPSARPRATSRTATPTAAAVARSVRSGSPSRRSTFPSSREPARRRHADEQRDRARRRATRSRSRPRSHRHPDGVATP